MHAAEEHHFQLARRRPVLWLLAGWTAVAVVLAAQTRLQFRLSGQPGDFLSLLGISLVGCAPWAAYTPGVVWLTRRARRLAAGRRSIVPALGLVAAVGALLVAADAALWATVAPWLDGRATPWGPRFASMLLLNSFLYLAIVLGTEAADHAMRAEAQARRAADHAERAAQLQAQLEEARLRALEAQLRPHFLHNTLNVIAELVHEAPDRADAMLTQLGMLLRRGLGPGALAGDAAVSGTGTAGRHLLPLAEELRFVAAYGALLGERFGDRVRLSLDVPDEAMAVDVPAYLLQPLVENAFEHGVRGRCGATVIGISARLDDALLQVVVRDGPAYLPAGVALGGDGDAADGDGPCDGEPAVRRTRDDLERGVGLGNTRARLGALYGSAAGVTVEREGDATTATVWLPAAPSRRPSPAGAP